MNTAPAPTLERGARRRRSVTRLWPAVALALSSLTCDVTNAVAPPGVEDITLRYEGDTVLVIGSASPLAVSASHGGKEIPGRKLRVVSSDPAVLAVSRSGDSLVATGRGRAILTVHLESSVFPDEGVSVAQSVQVVVQSLTIDRSEVLLTSLGDTTRLLASAWDAQGNQLAGMPVTWRSSDTVVATVDNRGVVTARTTGASRILAFVDNDTVMAAVSVEQRLARLTITPKPVLLDALGADARLTASGTDAGGSEVLPGAIAWSSSDSATVMVDADGVVLARREGSAWVHAAAGAADSVSVTVDQRASLVVISAPYGQVIQSLGDRLELFAAAYDRVGNSVQGGRMWRSLDPGVAEVDNGTVRGVGLGEARVVAVVDAAADTVIITVRNTPVLLEVLPASAELPSVGDSLALSVSAYNARGALVALDSVSWHTPTSSILQLLQPGLVEALAKGTGRVIASAAGLADTVTVVVTNVPDVVDIVPTNVLLRFPGDTLSPEASILNARGGVLERTAVAWSVAEDWIARVTESGKVIARDTGTTKVRARSPDGTRSDSVYVTVRNDPASIVLSGTIDTLWYLGEQVTYSAEVRNLAGQIITGYQVLWMSSSTDVASVSTSGTVTARRVGSALIIGQADQVADTVHLVVLDDPVTLEVSPSSLTLESVDDTFQLKVTARNAAGDIVSGVTPVWHVTDTVVASVLQDGRVIARAKGAALVVASLDGLADTTSLTVTNAPASVVIVPDSVRLLYLGDTITPPTEIRNARGALLPSTSVTWSSDDAAVTRVSSAGLITARDTGRTIVRATSGSLTDSVIVVVTNEPASVVLDGTYDMMTARGQTLDYAAEVRNLIGALISGYPVEWRSTNADVATVTSDGTVTAMGYGSALIVAQAGAAADTVSIVVRNPTLIYVDNSVVVAHPFGTDVRPFARIQDGIAFADAGDTVFVRRGSGPYVEALSIDRQMTVLGDSTAFVGESRMPDRLPLIVHDAGTAGISAAVSAPVTLRYFALRHMVDGPAIHTRGVDLRVEYFYVNPGDSTERAGRGILVVDAPGSARISRSVITGVRGFGLRLENAASARISDVTVNGVSLVTGTTGAGIDVVGGSGITLERVTARATGGPRVLVSGTADARIVSSLFAGRHQLVRLEKLAGATYIGANVFDLSLRSDDAFSTGSSADNRSALEITSSSNVSVVGNSFSESGSAAMDAVRLTAAGAGGAVRLLNNSFAGGRYSVRSFSSKSIWEMTGSRSEGAVRPVMVETDDLVLLESDTLVRAGGMCVEATGRIALTVLRSVFQNCTAPDATGTGQPAISLTNTSSQLTITDAVFTGANQTAITFLGQQFTARGNILSGAGTRTVTGYAAGASMQVDARDALVVRNTVTDYRDLAGLSLKTKFSLRADSNLVARNKRGVLFVDIGSVQAVHNDIADNLTTGVESGLALMLTDNWWGDGRGPRRDLAPAAVGDSLAGAATFDPVRAAPLYPGTTAAGLRHVRGTGQTGPAGQPLPKAFTVRVVNAAGRPVAGVSVTFAVTEGSGTVNGATSVAVISNASGLVEATLTPSLGANTVVVTGTEASLGAVNFTATGS